MSVVPLKMLDVDLVNTLSHFYYLIVPCEDRTTLEALYGVLRKYDIDNIIKTQPTASNNV